MTANLLDPTPTRTLVRLQTTPLALTLGRALTLANQCPLPFSSFATLPLQREARAHSERVRDTEKDGDTRWRESYAPTAPNHRLASVTTPSAPQEQFSLFRLPPPPPQPTFSNISCGGSVSIRNHGRVLPNSISNLQDLLTQLTRGESHPWASSLQDGYRNTHRTLLLLLFLLLP